MLVLSRKTGERIRIGEHIVLTVLESGKNQVRLGIEAPADLLIFREEIWSLLREVEDQNERKDSSALV